MSNTPGGLKSHNDELQKRRQIFRNALGSHDGKLMMAMLRDDFMSTVLFDQDPGRMAMKVGQHDLVQYMIDMSKE